MFFIQWLASLERPKLTEEEGRRNRIGYTGKKKATFPPTVISSRSLGISHYPGLRNKILLSAIDATQTFLSFFLFLLMCAHECLMNRRSSSSPQVYWSFELHSLIATSCQPVVNVNIFCNDSSKYIDSCISFYAGLEYSYTSFTVFHESLSHCLALERNSAK